MPGSRAGFFERRPQGYRVFIPEHLPPIGLTLDADLQTLLSQADQALGRLDGAVTILPEPDLFVLQYVRREAVFSSQIEGTNASLMDILEYEARTEQGERRVDVAEIVNYIAAMNHGLERLSAIPLSRRLLCEVHEILMADVRGGEPQKTPGEFRRSQNWIGGGSPATARFVPPPHDLVGDLFANLEDFLHGPDPAPALIKAGIAHAQFETIHPFLDGNGRTGRLLITFWLVERGILRKPVLYMSLYFKQHRAEYMDRLQAVRDEGDWEGWLAFFVDGVAQVATEATETATKILQLRERDRIRIQGRLGRRSGSAYALLDELFKRPVATISTARRFLGVSIPTASALLSALSDIGILEEMTRRQRGRIYRYREYLSLFPGAESRT